MKNELEVITRLKSYEPLWDGWKYNDKLFGSGGSGCVLGLSCGEDKSVVKVIYIEDNQLKFNAVKDEIETMVTLRSNYLVECLNYQIEEVFNKKGERIGYDFLIHMNEYEPFSEFLREEDYDPNELCLQLARDIGEALCVLHSNGILHRDIKPENIFIDNLSGERHFRLGDFGVSKRIGDMSGLTTTGTLNFMAPESFKYYEYSYRSDIYNLGMTLYYILNDLKFPVFTEEESQSDFDYNTDCRLHGEKLPNPVYGSDKFVKVVMKCCEANPKDRYKDISVALNDLFGQSMPVMGIPLKKESVIAPRKEFAQKKALRVVLFVIAGVIVVSASIFSIFLPMQNTVNNSKYNPQKVNSYINLLRQKYHQKSEFYSNDTIKTIKDNSIEISITRSNSAIMQTLDQPIDFWEIGLCKYECYFDDSGKLYYLYSEQGDSIYQIYLMKEDIIRVIVGGKIANDYYGGDSRITARYYEVAKNAQKIYDELMLKEGTNPLQTVDKSFDMYNLNASSKYISYSDLSGLTLDEVQLVINEIYAKHGYRFSEEPYKSVFESIDGYNPDTDSMDVVEKRFNEYENANLKVLGAYRKTFEN